jgi:hypothetical protein
MVIFHSYVSLPEGMYCWIFPQGWHDTAVLFVGLQTPETIVTLYPHKPYKL